MPDFSPADRWKALVLYGLNTATYKIALAKSLLSFCDRGLTVVPWDVLSKEFFDQYLKRLDIESPLPQAGLPGRLTTMERIIQAVKAGAIDRGEAIGRVGDDAFGDVIRRFHNLGRRSDFAGMFYEYDFGKQLVLTDAVHSLREAPTDELEDELDSRWSLLEGAFAIANKDYQLANDLRLIYIASGYERRDLTGNVPFLQGYQGNACFYCGEPMLDGDVHVDHVLPRQVVLHDEIWNLVLAHGFCNEQKTDRLVGEHFIEKLIKRNENIMGSNHPWKKKVEQAIGCTPAQRRRAVTEHYRNVSQILGWNYWQGSPTYSPETDPFYKSLITMLNNGENR